MARQVHTVSLMSESELRALQAEHARLEERYASLKNRRSVRAALALAQAARRLRRRFGTDEAGVTVASPTVRPTRSELGPDLPDVPLDLLENAPPVSVVIPVFNAPDDLRRCLDSVIRHTSGAGEIVVIDDASTDAEIHTILEELLGLAGVRVLSNARNLGFVATANRGFAATRGDVVLLNADTEVGPRWVDRLRLAAYGRPRVASVTAFSNNAGAFSAPIAGSNNELPAGVDVSAAARLVARSSQYLRPRTPTANGFCMYVKRVALDDVGVFDVEKYPRGYGEENDWSMRATDLGWEHVVDDASYVLHRRSASFGSEKQALAEAGRSRLHADHPSYPQRVEAFLASQAMATARQHIGEAFADAAAPVRPRVLYLLHGQHGGTPETSRDLAQAISGRFEAYILRSDGRTLVASDASGGEVFTHRLKRTVQIGDLFDLEYRTTISRLLVALDVDVLHIRHLMNHALDGPAVARALHIPVVLSIHDFYLVCPTAHLIDESGRFCGGVCTPGQGVCPAVPWVATGPHLKHEWVQVWRRHGTALLDHVDVMVAAHLSTRDRFQDMIPESRDLRWEVIEHGRDLHRVIDSPPAVGRRRPIRLLLAGNHGIAKGSDFVQAIRRLDVDGELEFHLMGDMWPDKSGVVDHGTYDRGDLANRVADIAPDALLLPSVTVETYSHIITEAWAMGLPVIVTDRGAPAERVRSTGAGWIISVDDPAQALDQILSGFGDGTFEQAHAKVAEATWPTTSQMATAYADLYDTLMYDRLTARVGGLSV